MKPYKPFLLFVFLTILLHQTDAQYIQWQQRLGGLSFDQASSIIQTTDSGYAVLGSTNSNDSVVYGNHGGSDYLLYKLDKNGQQQWHRWYGGSSTDNPYCIIETTDGGFLLTGSTSSNDGDISNNHGQSDWWLIKTGHNGFIEWQNCYGGSNNEGAGYLYSQYPSYYPLAVINTLDGGFIIAASSSSNDSLVPGNQGGNDFWIVKLDNNGTVQWQKLHGGSKEDIATSILQNDDGTYFVAGYSNSNDGDVTGMHVNGYVDYWSGDSLWTTDFWVMKMDTSGAILWEKTFGGSGYDIANSVCKSHHGGYMVAGSTQSIDGDVIGNHGYGNYWVIELDSTGNVVWKKCYGGSQNETANAIVQTDEGYMIAGSSNSNDIQVIGHHGTNTDDIWAVKIDTLGNIIWNNSFGGTDYDEGLALIKTIDGKYAIAGYANSMDGDVVHGAGGWDFWVIKINPDSITGMNVFALNNSLFLSPNPFNTQATLTLQGSYHSPTLFIYNLMGQEVRSIAVGSNKQINIPRNNLPAGMYFYKVIEDNKEVLGVGKMVIED